ncbi:hypothetical protein STEG23_028584, partial [Scotinomys teguina]
MEIGRCIFCSLVPSDTIIILRHTFLSMGFSNSKFCSPFACKSLKILNDEVNASSTPTLTLSTSVFCTVRNNSVK